MKKLIFYISTFLFLLASCKFGLNIPTARAAQSNQSKKQNETVVSATEVEIDGANALANSFIAKTASNFDKARFEKAGFTVLDTIPLNGWNMTYWNIAVRGSVLDSMAQARRIAGVMYTEPNYVMEASPYTVNSTPDAVNQSREAFRPDPTDDFMGYGLVNTHAVEAYEQVGYGDNTAYIAIIDTGTNLTHQDFTGVLLYAKTSFDGDEPIPYMSRLREIPLTTQEFDGAGHGTHCSGTMCALKNGKDTSGVAWKNTKLITYQGLSKKGSGNTWTIYGALVDLANTVKILKKDPNSRSDAEKEMLPSYIAPETQITQKTVPVNMSLGGSRASEFQFFAINYALSNDVLPVVAMGNDGAYTNSFAAALPGVLAVAAIDGRDKHSEFSNSGSWTSISAPGVGIESTLNTRNEGTQNMSGTSMATPFVTGSIGYLLSFDEARSLTPYQIKTLLEKTADKIDPLDTSWIQIDGVDWSEKYGYGRINVLNAAKALKELDGLSVPAENMKYTESTVTVVATNKGLSTTEVPMPTPSVTLLRKRGTDSIPIAQIGAFEDNPLCFKGLPFGNYEIMARIGESVQKENFTIAAASSDQTVTLHFDLPLLWVSTVPNLAYNNGEDETDTAFEVYEADTEGHINLSTAKPIMTYDQDYLDSFFIPCERGKKYFVLVKGFVDEENTFRGGNYALRIGSEPLDLNGVNIADGSRSATENDSHEDDNSPEAAKEKGNAYNTTYACNLVATGFDADGKANTDPDWFYIEVPVAP